MATCDVKTESMVLEFQGRRDKALLDQVLEDAYYKGSLSDLTFSAQGEQLRAHKLIIVAYCETLRDEIMRKSNEPNLEIELDLEPSMLRTVLAYIYTNQVTIVLENLRDVAGAAHMLGVTDLRNMCLSVALAAEEITVNNCLETWIEADKIEDDKCIEEAMEIAIENFKTVKRSVGLRNLPGRLFEKLICHPNLPVEKTAERLSTALWWFRENTQKRIDVLANVLDTLSLGQLERWYVDQLLDDPFIQQFPRIMRRLRDANQSFRDYIRSKSDLSPATMKNERCLLYLNKGSRKGEICIYAIRMRNNFEQVLLGYMETSFRDRGIFNTITSSCFYNNTLYISGLGPKSDAVWSYDILTRKSQQISSLCVPRDQHAMGVGSDECLYIFGGEPVKLFTFGEQTIEAINLHTGTAQVCGDLIQRNLSKYACCRVQNGDNILVTGATYRKQIYIQVYDVQKRCIRYAVSVSAKKDVSHTNQYGAVIASGYLIGIGSNFTVVAKVEDLLQGKNERIRLCENYESPNYYCAVALSEDEEEIILLGGSYQKQRYSVYTAKVTDIIQDTFCGWNPVATKTNFEDCWLNRGYVVADICLPMQHK